MAVTPLRRATDVPGQARELRAALEALSTALAALARCRAVGAANQELTDVTLDVLGRTGAYSRQGAGRPRDPRGRDLHARV